MTVSVKPFVTGKFVENAFTSQYIAPASTRAIIDKATVTNTVGSSVTITVNIVPAAGAVSDANRVIATRAIAAGECYTCPELVGHILEPGGFISTLAGTASALSLRISGREVTN